MPITCPCCRMLQHGPLLCIWYHVAKRKKKEIVTKQRGAVSSRCCFWYQSITHIFSTLCTPTVLISHRPPISHLSEPTVHVPTRIYYMASGKHADSPNQALNTHQCRVGSPLQHIKSTLSLTLFTLQLILDCGNGFNMRLKPADVK